MSTTCQLIAFIAPSKFGRLVGEDAIPGYRLIDPDSSNSNYLDNFQSVVYVYDDKRTPIVGKLNQSEAHKTSVLLVPDGCLKVNFDYVPVGAFKLLSHSDKGAANKIAALRKSPFYGGELKSSEEPDTPYGALAKAIKFKTLAADLPKVLAQIPSFDPVLEAKLVLLQTVLAGEQPHRTLLDFLKESLPGVETDLEEFNKTQGHTFSPEYQLAYSKLRNSLKLR